MRLCFLLLPVALLFPACGHDHDGHSHADPAGASAAQGGDHHGTPHALGTVKCGPLELAAAQLGEVKAGGEIAVEVTSTSGAAITTPVRAWIGTADAKGSRKALLSAEARSEGKLHGHVEVPNPLQEGAQLWLETETADGAVTGALALHR
ncbi:MAG: hypothetical protein U1E73_07300 [Planctomycetota bacterium]